MSSILKALKKLENETAETRLPTWPHTIDNRNAIAHRNRRSSKRDRIIILLLVVCVLILVGKTLLGLKKTHKETASSPLVAQKTSKSPEKTDAPAPIAHKKKRVPPKPINIQDAPKKPDRSMPEVLPKPAVESTPPATREGEEIVTEPPVTSANGAPAPQPSPSKTPPIVTLPTATFQNTGLRLQALVWSEVVADRFAVINNRILRENDRIEKAMVITIEKEYVVVELEGVRWQLKHQLH